jgi:SAM-dependent methyltransferase
MSQLPTDGDVQSLRERYEQRYRQYGYAPGTLDWDKGKQPLRFDILTSPFDLKGRSILDIGCGFGDLNLALRRAVGDDYDYLGVDVVESFVAEGRSRYGGDRVQFVCAEFLSLEDLPPVDVAIASGTFNLKWPRAENRTVIRRTMERAFELAREGLAFDFLSDKVDFRKDNTHHSSPEDLLAFAYGLSRNVMLLNHYMPFEFALFVFKDDSFDPASTIFNRWLRHHPDLETGLRRP